MAPREIVENGKPGNEHSDFARVIRERRSGMNILISRQEWAGIVSRRCGRYTEEHLPIGAENNKMGAVRKSGRQQGQAGGQGVELVRCNLGRGKGSNQLSPLLKVDL